MSSASVVRLEGENIRILREMLDERGLRWTPSCVGKDSAVKLHRSQRPAAQARRSGSDVFRRLGRTLEWDTVAGHAVLRAAGREMSTREGAPLRYGRPRLGNPHFVAQAL